MPDCKLKRKRVVNYLAGNGVKEWRPKKELIGNDINITAALEKFRDRNIKQVEANKTINDLRILSLSFIFPINKIEVDKSIANHMRSKVVESLMSLASSREVQFPAVPDKAVIYCFDQLSGKKDEYNPENEMGKYVKELVAQYKSPSNAAIKSTSEASFMNKHLMPFLNKILIDQNFENSIYSMIDGYENDGKKPNCTSAATLQSPFKPDLQHTILDKQRAPRQALRHQYPFC